MSKFCQRKKFSLGDGATIIEKHYDIKGVGKMRTKSLEIFCFFYSFPA